MFWQNLKNQVLNFLKSGTWLSRIVVAEVVLWLVLLIADFVANYFTLKGSVATAWVNEWLCMMPDNHFWSKPWTAVTYLFVHQRFWSVFANVVVLIVAGHIIYHYRGGRTFAITFFCCGLAGALFAFLFGMITPVFDPLWCASPAALGMFMAVVGYMPDYEVFFFPRQQRGFKLRYIAYIFVAIDLLGALSAQNIVNIANLGGELCGFLMLYLPKVTGGVKLKFKRPERKKQSGDSAQRPMSDEEYNRRRAENERRVDEILDKISQSGYEKLTPEEKEFLFKSSNNR